MRFPPGRGDTPEEAGARLRLLMEDASDVLDADACQAAIRAGVKVWRFLPTCAEIVEAAKEFVADRALHRKLDREVQEAATRKALPAPEYVDLTTDENRRVLDMMYAAMDRAAIKEGGTPIRRREAQEPASSKLLQNPTDADYSTLIIRGDAADAMPGPGLRSPTLIALAEKMRAKAEGREPIEDSPYQPYDAPPEPQIGMPYDQKRYDEIIQATAVVRG